MVLALVSHYTRVLLQEQQTIIDDPAGEPDFAALLEDIQNRLPFDDEMPF